MNQLCVPGPLAGGCFNAATSCSRRGLRGNALQLQTRFQSIKIATPTTEELAEFLCAHWRVPRDVAARVAVGSGGCVRAALADLETWLDVKGGGLL